MYNIFQDLKNNIYNYRLYTPILTGYALSMFCKIPKNSGSNLPQRPPAFVFKIVWPILYILLGLVWSKSYTQKYLDMIFAFITFLLCLWIFVYNCKNNKKYGIYIIAYTIASVICSMTLNNNNISKILLIPLLAWLIIAYQLNWDIINL